MDFSSYYHQKIHNLNIRITQLLLQLQTEQREKEWYKSLSSTNKTTNESFSQTPTIYLREQYIQTDQSKNKTDLKNETINVQIETIETGVQTETIKIIETQTETSNLDIETIKTQTETQTRIIETKNVETETSSNTTNKNLSVYIENILDIIPAKTINENQEQTDEQNIKPKDDIITKTKPKSERGLSKVACKNSIK